MTKQVAFAFDDTIKDELFEKCKKEWISMKSFFTYCAKAFIEDKISVGLNFNSSQNEVYSSDIHKARVQWQKDLKDWSAVDWETFLDSLGV